MSNELKKDGGKIRQMVIRTVKDLMKATVLPGATMKNGGFNLFTEELKKYLIGKNGSLMTWEDWYKKPHPLVSKTEDVEFEVIEPKQITNGNTQAHKPRYKKQTTSK